MASEKSLAAEIEAVMRDEIIPRWMGPNSFVEGYEEAAQKITARIAALQSRAFEDGARWMRERAVSVAEDSKTCSAGEIYIAHQISDGIAALPLQPEGERSDA